MAGYLGQSTVGPPTGNPTVPNPIAAANPQSKIASSFTTVGSLNDAIKLGWIPLRNNGSQFTVQSFLGGFLLDGAPLNVWMGLGWYSGQMAALQPYWQSGQVPIPPANVTSQPTIPMPADVANNFNAYETAQQNIFGLPWYLWAAAAGIYLLLR